MKPPKRWYFSRMWNMIRTTPEFAILDINNDCGHLCTLTKEDHEIFEKYEKQIKSGELGEPMRFNSSGEFMEYLKKK